MYATDHDLKHLLRVSLATCQLPVFSYVRLRINSSASRQVQYLMHTFESICPKPIKKAHQTITLLLLLFFFYIYIHAILYYTIQPYLFIDSTTTSDHGQ